VVDRLREVAATEALAVEVTVKVKARVQARRKDLLIEWRDLPAEITKLSDDGRRLMDSARDIDGPGKKLLYQRLEEVGEHLGRLQSRLAEVERELATLEDIEVEAGWVAQCLADFGTCWDVLTPENRGRLIRSLVHRIEVDEPANRIEMHVTNLAAAVPLPAVAAGTHQEVSQ
jgi:hypothetical protein